MDFRAELAIEIGVHAFRYGAHRNAPAWMTQPPLHANWRHTPASFATSQINALTSFWSAYAAMVVKRRTAITFDVLCRVAEHSAAVEHAAT